MTKNEILRLEAGRELDLLVEKKVFLRHRLNSYEKSLPIIPYSTDIKAAWEVVEKLKNDFVFDLIFNNNWTCQFLLFHPEEIGDVDQYIADGKTAPEAIVKAALLAVMEGK